jgi:hypothetical protein
MVYSQYHQTGSPDIVIYDLNGKMLCSSSLTDLSAGITQVNIDMSCFKAGIYLYSIRLGEYNIPGKLIKM